MASQFNRQPTYQTPLIDKGNTVRDWYFFFTGLFKRIPPANVEPVTPTGSPYVYSAEIGGALIVEGGTVSDVEFSRDGTTWYSTGQTSGMFTVGAADRLRVTYSSAPNLTFVPT